MSNLSMQGGATGTGTVTLLAPSTSTNRTINLPDSNGTMATAESTLTQFNASGSAPVYACRAWVNFDGTGTPAIRASGNVSSITDNTTGNYSVNFTTAMPDANYSVQANVTDDSANNRGINVQGTFGTYQTTSAVRVAVYAVGVGAVDPQGVFVAIFR